MRKRVENSVITFPINKRINADLFIDSTASFVNESEMFKEKV